MKDTYISFEGSSSDYEAGATWSNNISTTTGTDITKLRNRIGSVTANSLIGIVFQVSTGGVGNEFYPGFKNFVTSLHTGTSPFNNTPSKLSDKTEIGYEIDIIPGSSAIYYANVIITALNNLGFNLPVCNNP